MVTKVLVQYLGIPDEEVQRILELPELGAYSDPGFKKLVEQVDVSTLEKTVNEARKAYEAALPKFITRFRRKYKLPCPVTSYTLSIWMVQLLKNPEDLQDGMLLNVIIPREIMAENAPLLLDLLKEMPEGNRSIWQRTLATFLLPLIAVKVTEKPALAGASA